jgi:hypothetical protein
LVYYYYIFTNDNNKCTYQSNFEAIDSFNFKKCKALDTVAPISSPCPTKENAAVNNAGKSLANEKPLVNNPGKVSTNEKPLVTNAGKVSTNEKPLVTNAGKVSANEKPLVTNAGKVSTNEKPLVNNAGKVSINVNSENKPASSVAKAPFSTKTESTSAKINKI